MYSQEESFFKRGYWLLFVPIVALVVFAYYKSDHSKLLSIEFALVFLLTLIPFVFISMIKIRLRVDREGISYQFYPIHLKPKRLPWSDIDHPRLVRFDSLRHYWGSGYRKSRKYGLGLVIGGPTGLFFVEPDGQKVNVEITRINDFISFLDTIEHPVNTERIAIEAHVEQLS